MALSGKIENTDFDRIIRPQCGFKRQEVLTGPAFGTDVSVVDLKNGLGLAMTSDPLSLIPSLGLQESAWLSVHLMANDMATTGFAPMYAQMVLNLPPWLSEEDFVTYWGFIHQYCEEIGVAITGGHTGGIEGQNSTIAGGGTMILTAPLDQIRLSNKARSGDVIILTKEAALSSAAILAMSFPETVTDKLGKEISEKGAGLFYKTSSLNDGLIAARHASVSAMHDVTEGGVLGAIYEMAISSGNGVRVDKDLLPVGETQKAICRLFGLDPGYCIGAGSMVIAARKGGAGEIIEDLNKNGIQATIAGAFTAKHDGYTLIENGQEKPLPYYHKDPYWEAFFKAYQNGWK